MGNRCVRPDHESEKFQPLQTVKCDDRKEIAVDWDDEKSVSHRSAMNSLHNYALGKMGHLETEKSVMVPTSPQKNGLRKPWSISGLSKTLRKSGSQSISFANELHQTFLFERFSLSMERERAVSEGAFTADDFHRAVSDCAGTCKTDDCHLPPPLSPTTSEFVACSAAACKPACHLPESAMPWFPCLPDEPADTADFLRIE